MQWNIKHNVGEVIKNEKLLMAHIDHQDKNLRTKQKPKEMPTTTQHMHNDHQDLFGD